MDKKRRKSEITDEYKKTKNMAVNQGKNRTADENTINSHKRSKKLDKTDTLETVKKKRKKSEATNNVTHEIMDMKQMEAKVSSNEVENGTINVMGVSKKQKKNKSVQNTTIHTEERKKSEVDERKSSGKKNKKRRKSEPALDTLELLHRGQLKSSQSFSHPTNIEESGQGDACAVVDLACSQIKKTKKKSNKIQKERLSSSPKANLDEEVLFTAQEAPSAADFQVVEDSAVEIWVPNKKYKAKLKRQEKSSSFAAFEKNPTTPTALVRKSIGSRTTPRTAPKKGTKVMFFRMFIVLWFNIFFGYI